MIQMLALPLIDVTQINASFLKDLTNDHSFLFTPFRYDNRDQSNCIITGIHYMGEELQMFICLRYIIVPLHVISNNVIFLKV